MNNKLVTAALLASLSFNAFAEDAAAPKDSLTMSTELGALFKTGANKSKDIKVGFDANYTKDLWRHTLNFDALTSKTEIDDSNGDENYQKTAQEWKIVGQTNYTIDTERSNYIYGKASYDNNDFGGFESKSSISAGWGRRWFESKNGTFDADIGPGYNSDAVRLEDTNGNEYTETKGAFIVQAQALYTRKINEHVEFKQELVIQHATKSGENSYYNAESSLTTKLISTLQLKVSFKVDHNTEVDDDKENTNTQTSVTLVYSF
jgi:putative salt-induced outer membrane protein